MKNAMRPRGGFTLFELLVVIIIITILAGSSIMLLNVFFRGQGVRQGAAIVSQVIAQAKQQAARTHQAVFLVFSPPGQDAWLEIHTDANEDGVYQGDQKVETKDPDPADGPRVDLPKFVTFEYAPVWIGFAPSGYMTFSSGFSEIQASMFDAIMAGSSPRAVGDVVLRQQNQKVYMCIDLDRASGRARRAQFLNQEE
ncbi:MAG: prepilin-type N-terminal cleavage/methylation domain-containing protein [Planctomycetota bacterium]